jgi:hypothetical protein
MLEKARIADAAVAKLKVLMSVIVTTIAAAKTDVCSLVHKNAPIASENPVPAPGPRRTRVRYNSF